MSIYKEVVEKLFRTNSHYVIANNSEDHAAVLYEDFFKYGKKEVRIFCHKLNPKVFGRKNVCDSVEEFLNRGGMLYIAVQEEPKSASRFL